MGYSYKRTASGLNGTPDELFVTRCGENHLNIVVSNSGKGSTVCIDPAREAEVVREITGYARAGSTDPWRQLRERLIKDVADYREAGKNYARSSDIEGVCRANAKAAAVAKVLDYMDEFERASLPGRRVAESESVR